jgi:tetratricopeptide (TPR) repeat protein
VGVKGAERSVFDLAHSDPGAAADDATRALAEHPLDDAAKAQLLWIRGLARREMGLLTEARSDLELAIALADERAVAAQIAVTLSLVLMYIGDSPGALELLDGNEDHLHGADRARLVLQRALLHHRLGRLGEADSGYRSALDELVASGDAAGAARAHANLGLLCAQRGRVDEGVEHLREAITSGDAIGHAHLAAISEQNLGYVFSLEGNVPAALGALGNAEQRFAQLGNVQQLALTRADRASVLLAANLVDEARREADTALAAIEAGGNVTDVADTALLAARTRLAAGDIDGARDAARLADDLFGAHDRRPWRPLARLVEVQADLFVDPTVAEAARGEDVADALAEADWTTEATSAYVMAGRVALQFGDLALARRVLGKASGAHERRPAAEMAAAHLATALLEEAEGDRTAAHRSVTRGLRTLWDNQATLGALELRAHAAAHGEALAELGARIAVADRRPRDLLARIESARGMTALLPSAYAPDDAELAAMLTELRTVAQRARETAGEGRVDPALESQRLDIERRIREHSRRRRASEPSPVLSMDDALRAVGDHVLIEYGNIADELWAVTVRDGRAKMHDLGPIDRLQTDIDSIEFALHRLNRTQGSMAAQRAAHDTIRVAGERLQAALLPASVLATDRSLVIVPTGRLHGLAWRALPALVARPTMVAPSLMAWAFATRAAATRRAPRTLLIGGPALTAASSELAALSRIHRNAVVLDVHESTAERCITQLGGVTLAHLACHGSFRSDNPLFSTLRVADGDITVYDLEQCRRLPRTMVLSACNAAVSAVLRGGALLGMSSALIQLGVSSVIAPLTPVSDERSVALMTRLHQELRAGARPAAALARAATVAGEPDATAAAFVVIGA